MANIDIWILLSLLNFNRGYEVTKQGLTSIPTDIPSNETEVILFRNNIGAIWKADFNNKFPSLETIGLLDNQISHIETGCFKGTSLRNLNLNDNKLTFFPDLSEVANTVNLVRLSRNRVKQVLSSDVANLNALKRLDLKENPLVLITEVLGLLPSLEVLNLTGVHMPCCCHIAWLKDSLGTLVIPIDAYPCSNATTMELLPWSDIQNRQLITQACPASNEQWTLCRE
jgi:hypothetical protein